MTIVVNGNAHELAAGSSVADAVEAAGSPRDARGVAAALEGEVVPRAEWESTPLADGQQIEVVQAVQGG